MGLVGLVSLMLVIGFVVHICTEMSADAKFKAERNHQAYLKALREQGIEVHWHSDNFMTHEDFIKIIKGL